MLEATKRDNELKLFISGVSKLKFDVIERYVSEGEEADKTVEAKIGKDGVSWVLTFKAGRHVTEEVAEHFIKMITSDSGVTGASVGCCTSESKPKKLNFAYMGNLEFDYYDTLLERTISCVGENIVFAQGHNNDDQNNWWVGGSLMRNVLDVKYAKAVSQKFKGDGVLSDQVLMFVPRPTEPNEFSVSVVGV